MSSSRTKQPDYFDDNDDEEFNLPSRGVASTTNVRRAAATAIEEEEEEDPLDAFMKSNEKQLAIDSIQPISAPLEIVSNTDYNSDISESNVYNHSENHLADNYDSDGNTRNDKVRITPLIPIDHSQLKYPFVGFNFYKQNTVISDMTSTQISEYLNVLQVSITSSPSTTIPTPRPIQTFAQLGLPSKLHELLIHSGYTTPTPIQCITLPLALSGYDVIGLAKTGSGKTISYIIPILIHIINQPMMNIGDGPIALVLAPTRELVMQITNECKKLAKVFNISSCGIYGGEGKYEMRKALQSSPEIVIATPGRYMDLLSTNASNLFRVSILVLDEADRMFDLGFEAQVKSIVRNIRPIRQTLLFSATMKKRIEGFARDILSNPIRVVVGSIGQANSDIQQQILIFNDLSLKYKWLVETIETYLYDGKILVFVSSKIDTEELSSRLVLYYKHRELDISVGCIYGDKSQDERNSILKSFRNNTIQVMIATDIASRGLDIKNIRLVINYEAPKNIDTYVHRIGRTGRMGVEGVSPGVAITLLSNKDANFASELVQNLRQSNQEISESLLSLASKATRSFHGSSSMKGRNYGIGNAEVTPAMTSSMLSNVMGTSKETVNTKRKSRFSDEPPVENSTHSRPVLSGFVKASSVYASVTEDNEQSLDSKRSRPS